ncbi:unnamed protein product [Scytosiphon promiscuus]
MDASAAKNFNPLHARVLVVGPMAAGKTTLVHSLCHGATSSTPQRRPPPTVGCNVDVKMVDARNADRSIEFWDVGGNPDAALARGMFLEGCEAAGVLLVYDVSNPRSLRELRAWVKELSSAGVPIHAGSRSIHEFNSGAGYSRTRSDFPSTNGWKGSDSLHHREPDNDNVSLADLEGGSAGAAGKGARGRLPVLVVGSKEELGEGVRRAGAALASELCAGHVTVCGFQPADEEEPFERFFGEVFRYHCGQRAPDGGEDARVIHPRFLALCPGTPARGQWTNQQDSYFPEETAEVGKTDRSSYTQHHQPQKGWTRQSPGQALEQHPGTGSASAWRTGDGGRNIGGGTAGAARTGGGRLWPVPRAAFPFATTAASSPRKKQS